MKIYVVIGETGEYDDFRRWNVKAFGNKRKATNFKKKLNKIASFSNSERTCKDLVLAGDKNAQVDYTGTEYLLEEMEYEC